MDDDWADIGASQARADGQTAFAQSMRYRQKAKEAFVQVDSASRIQRALCRKAAPMPLDYKVGDIVSYQRDQGARNEETRWQRGARIVGFDGNKTAWCIVDGAPVCVSTERMRPCTPAEALAYQYLQREYKQPMDHSHDAVKDCQEPTSHSPHSEHQKHFV